MAYLSPVVLRLMPLVAGTSAHICTYTQTRAFSTFYSLPEPTTHSPTVRVWARRFLLRLGHVVMGSHITYAVSLYYNFHNGIEANEGLDDDTKLLYMLALTFSALSFTIVYAKGKALFACEGGKDNMAVLEGAKSVARVDEMRLLFVDMPGYILTWIASLRVLRCV